MEKAGLRFELERAPHGAYIVTVTDVGSGMRVGLRAFRERAEAQAAFDMMLAWTRSEVLTSFS